MVPAVVTVILLGAIFTTFVLACIGVADKARRSMGAGAARRAPASGPAAAEPQSPTRLAA